MLKSACVFFIIAFLGIFTIFAVFYNSPHRPFILIISFDGFRYDYLNKNITPTLDKIRHEGVQTDYMRNVFITKTFPNHHSIATGLFPSSHGVLANSLYDVRYEKVISYSEELWKFGNSVIPLWSLNEIFNHHSGVYMWPGGEFKYQGILPTFAAKFNVSISWTDRIDTVISWFVHPLTPANLVFLYFEDPDRVSHSFGPESDEVMEQIVRCDNITRYLFDQLVESGLMNKLNVFLLSDHGMDSVTTDKIINLTHYVNKSKYLTASSSPALHVIPKEGEFEEVFNALKAASEVENFTLYSKDEYLDRWHYVNVRAPPLLLLADEGFGFDDLLLTAGSHINESRKFGVHGYDNQISTMHSFFIALGPLLRKNYKISPFDSVDLYSLFCKILELQIPQTNGSLSNVASMLANEARSKIPLRWIFITGEVSMLLCACLFAFYLMRKTEISEDKNHDYMLLRSAEAWAPVTNDCHQASLQSLPQRE